MMDFFAKNKMLFWLVVILIILNCVTMTSLWMRKPPKPPHGPQPGPRDGGKLMAERLGLSDEQAGQLEQIRENHFHRTRPLQDDMHKIRMDILDEQFAAEPNTERIEQLLVELESKSGEFERQLYRHFQELRDMCEPEQAEELYFMLIDLIESTRPRGPRHPGPGAPGRRGPGHMPPPHH